MAENLPNTPPPPPPAPPVVQSTGKAFKTARHTFDPLKIHFAINSANLPRVLELLKTDLDLDYVIHGNTPLILAIIKEHYDIALALVAAGADVNIPQRGTWCKRPAHFASHQGHVELLAEILAHGADVNEMDQAGFGPLHWACSQGHVDVVTYLLDKTQVDVNALDGMRRSPLHRAAEHGFVEIVKKLVDKGAHLNITDGYGWSPLMQPVVCNLVDVVNVLLSLGADPNVCDHKGNNALHLACGRLRGENLVVLSVTGMNFYTRHLKASNVATQLAHDNIGYDIQIVFTLICYGANLNLTNHSKISPLAVAALEGNIDIMKLLISSGANLHSEQWILERDWPHRLTACPDFCEWLYDKAGTIESLQDHCRVTIVQHLPGDINSNVGALPIPQSMRQYLQIVL